MGDRNAAVAGREQDGVADSTVEYHEPTGTYRTEFDHDTRRVSDVVVWAVARVSDCDPLALPSLYEAVDTDALNRIFASNTRRGAGPGTVLSLVYAGMEVTVNGHGTIQIEPLQ